MSEDNTVENSPDSQSKDPKTSKTKKRVGRPRKTSLEKAKKPGKRGRPKGTAAIMNDYKSRMIASPKSRKVLDKMFEIALDDEHKHQAACMKMVVDRVLPVASFEADVKKGQGNQIRVSISGIGEGGSVNISSAPEEPEERIKDLEGEYSVLEAQDDS